MYLFDCRFHWIHFHYIIRLTSLLFHWDFFLIFACMLAVHDRKKPMQCLRKLHSKQTLLDLLEILVNTWKQNPFQQYSKYNDSMFQNSIDIEDICLFVCKMKFYFISWALKTVFSHYYILHNKQTNFLFLC
jgi:hypothetical protein